MKLTYKISGQNEEGTTGFTKDQKSGLFNMLWDIITLRNKAHMGEIERCMQVKFTLLPNTPIDGE